MTEFLAAAKRYRALGLHPIPCAPKDKRPLVSWKAYQDRQPTEQELENWWRATPDANVAIVLGRGLMAVDVDGPEGDAALREAGIELPLDAPTSQTANGYHVFLKTDAFVGDRVGLLPKVDIRGVGYVIAPPSVHPTGAKYKWITSMESVPEVPAPPSLLALLERSAKPVAPPQTVEATSAASGWVAEALAGIGEGQRDHTCTRLAGYFLGKGVPVEATEALLTAWADRCTPPFPADQVIKCVASIAKRQSEPDGPAGAPASIAAAIDETFSELQSGTKIVRATELSALDELLDGGFRPGDYIIGGARPSVGKTALALQIARRNAKAGQGVLVVSREMTVTALTRRLLVQESRVRASSVRSGKLVDVEWDMLKAGAERLRVLPLWITTSAINIEQIAESIASFEPSQLALVVVDYLQLVRPPADIGRDKRAGVEFVSQELKRLAVQHNLSVLCLSSLSRPPKDAGRNWRPTLADLRESGELEHDADAVLLMHRDFGSDLCELNVAKNRDGRVGGLKLKFSGDLLTFEEIGE